MSNTLYNTSELNLPIRSSENGWKIEPTSAYRVATSKLAATYVLRSNNEAPAGRAGTYGYELERAVF
jgi:hypothetical protein